MGKMSPLEAATPAGDTAAVVRLSGVAKTYRSGAVDVAALKGLSLEIPYHRFSVVIGASGSGKTTLLNLIGCIDSPTRGAVEVCGQKIAELADDAVSDFRARNIGFIFQTFSLVPVLSAYENVEYPLLLVGMAPAERRQRTLEMLEAVGPAGPGRPRPHQRSRRPPPRGAIGRARAGRPQSVPS